MKSGLGNGKDSFYLYITSDFYVKNRKKSEKNYRISDLLSVKMINNSLMIADMVRYVLTFV